MLGEQEASIDVYAKDKDLFPPLSFAVVDQQTEDFGVQARLAGEDKVADLRAAYVAGLNIAYGSTRNRQFVNAAGRRGALLNDVWEQSYLSDTGSRPVATAADALYKPGDGTAFHAGIEVRW